VSTALGVDRACDGFEEEWLAGGRPQVEDHLARAPEAERPVVLPELVLLDVYYRRRAGQTPIPSDYRDRFPGLDPDWLARALDQTALGTKSVPGPAAELGRLGGYDLVEELGRGAMGVVFKAVQRVAERVVAVKVLPAGVVGDRVHDGRFAAEVQALARLRHPHIVEVYEVGEASGAAFFSMEFAPGGTLAARVKAGPVPVAEAAELVRKLADAVEAAHTAGVLHRDIKPANVLLTADGEPKLSDFGLAKRTDREDGLTRTGAVMGTPSYMAPEQAGGAKQSAVGPRTDVYGLGATLYELLTGRPPFKTDEPHETIRQVLRDDPIRPRALRPDVPADLEAVCLKCLEKDPAGRYPSARALADDLTRWQRGEPTAARPRTWRQRTWRRVRRRWKPIAAVLVLAALAGTAAALWPREPAREIEARLRRGESVTLIGPTGKPKYQRWVVGAGGTEDPRGETPFLVSSAGGGLLELVPDPQNDRFRLSAEFRVESSTTMQSDAGIYFAHVPRQFGLDRTLDVAILLKFPDDIRTDQPRFRIGDPVNLLWAAFERDGEKKPETLDSLLAKYWVREAKVIHDRPWRKVVVEVVPGGVRAFWREPDQTLTPLAPNPAREDVLRADLPRFARTLSRSWPWIDPDAIRYQPRGGLGLYVRDGRVFFRNVVLEPLAANP
jgi:hypothetical protein